MSQENVEIVRRAVAAVMDRRDFDAALKDVAPDCEIDASSNLGEWRGVHRGHDQIRQLWRSWLEPWESSWSEIDEVIDAGDRVVTCATGHFRGRDGIEVTAKQSFVWTFRDGVITHVEALNERAEALKAAGLSE
jgi:ketosteroid isomerase-like protein